MITVGCDPELFVEVNGSIIPCVGLIPGSKAQPFKVPRSRTGLHVHEDVVTVEFNMKPSTPASFFKDSVRALNELHTFVGATIPGAVLRNIPFHEFSAKDLDSEQAVTFGCDPDFNAWERGARREPPSLRDVGRYRFAGGHIHIGYDVENCPVPDWAIVQFMETMVYVKYLGHDQQGPRRKFYGQAGCFRPKSYGLEYRTPSNFWVGTNRHFVEDLSNAASRVIANPEAARKLWPRIEAQSDAIRKCIETETISKDVHNLSDELWNSFLMIPEV